MRRPALCLLALGALLVLNGAAAAQEKYPSKPIKILVPYGPGSATDIVIRLVGEPLRQVLGQPVVIENKPGAFGLIAIEEMARAKPDGYTLQVGNTGTNALAPVVYAKKFSIDYGRDVVAVTRLSEIPLMFVATTKDFAPKTLAALVDYARQRPGKVRYGSVGVGSNNHYEMASFAHHAGLDLVHIPNKAGGAGVINDLAGGDIHVALANIAGAAGMIRAGHLRALAIVSDQRVAEYPDVPTMAEAGYGGISAPLWSALFAPAATPKETLETLHRAVVQAVNAPIVQDAFKKQLIRAAPSASLDDAKAWLRNEMAAWSKVVNEVKVELAD